MQTSGSVANAFKVIKRERERGVEARTIVIIKLVVTSIALSLRRRCCCAPKAHIVQLLSLHLHHYSGATDVIVSAVCESKKHKLL